MAAHLHPLALSVRTRLHPTDRTDVKLRGRTPVDVKWPPGGEAKTAARFSQCAALSGAITR